MHNLFYDVVVKSEHSLSTKIYKQYSEIITALLTINPLIPKAKQKKLPTSQQLPYCATYATHYSLIQRQNSGHWECISCLRDKPDTNIGYQK